MKALYFDGSGLDERDLPVPEPREGEALVKIRYAGICSTDLEILKGYMDFRGIPGHEFVGTVESAGRKDLYGRRVVGEINFPCGSCELCSAGLGKHCARRRVLGISGADGVFAEYAVLPEANLHAVPDAIPDKSAVFTELLAAACEFTGRVDIFTRTEAAVLGDGRLAAMTAQVLAETAGKITLIGADGEKMETISSLGIDTLHLDEAKRAGRSYDLVVECTGSASGLSDAVALCRPRSVLVLKTTLREDTVFNQSPVAVDEITIVGSRCGPFDMALELLESGKVKTDPFLSAVYPFSGWREAFSRAAERNIFKVILELT